MRFKSFIPLILLLSSLEAREEEPWGKDSDLAIPLSKRSEHFPSVGIAGKIAHSIISFHQHILSPTTGKRSSFRPTSSRYMELAIKRYGFFKGFLMGCDRLLRENGEAWVYRTIDIDGTTYKYDPAVNDKFSR